MKPYYYRNNFNKLKNLMARITVTILLLIITLGLYVNNSTAQIPVPPEGLYGSPSLGNLPDKDDYTLWEVDDPSELKTVIINNTNSQTWITLKDNIPVVGDYEFTFTGANNDLVIDLDMVNFTTDSNFIFKAVSPHKAVITIKGSSMIADGGFQLQGDVTFNYFGTYSSGRADVFADNATGDNIEFNLTGFGSQWDAYNNMPSFINQLPTSVLDYDKGTIVVGELGTATVNIASGNKVQSGETIVGSKQGSTGTVNISGIYEVDNEYNIINGAYERIKKATTWDNTGTIYIGYAGTGTVNVHHGAVVKTGSIGIGISTGSTGELNVTGLVNTTNGMNYLDTTINPNYIVHQGIPLDPKGRDNDYIVDAKYFNQDATRIIIYGRNDENNATFLNPTSGVGTPITTLSSSGTGVMNITEGAIIIFDETQIDSGEIQTDSGEPSNFTPKITLGAGDSIISNSLIIGARDAHDGDLDFGGTNDNFDDVGEIDGRNAAGTLQANTLTFKNNAVLQGNLKIFVGTTTFEDKAILSPGFGSYQFYMPSNEDLAHEKFGQVNFTGTFEHKTDAITIIDFDVHGDRKYGTGAGRQTAYPNGTAGKEDNQPYAGNATSPTYRGRDLISVTGDADLAGDIYFRPQTGYYSDHVEVDFMRVTGNIDGQYENLHLYPYRWFKNYKLDATSVANQNLFVADRCTTPFTDVARNFNQRGVGGALNNIFNAQNNYKWLPILDWVWCMNDEQLREAERLLSGEIKASSFYLPIRSPWRFGFDRVNWSNNGHKVYFGPQNAAQPQFAPNAAWATGYYDYQSIDDDHNSSAIATQRVSLMAGYDRALPTSFDVGFLSDSAIGALFSYSQPKLDQKGNRTLADDYLVGFHSATRLFATYEVKSWLGIGTQKYRLRRSIPIPGQDNTSLHAVYKGNSASASTQIARPVKWYSLTFRPHIAFDLNYIKQYHANETFHGDVMQQTALTYHASDWTQFFARTGLRLDYSKSCFNIHATLGYSYLLLGQQAPKTTHEFTYAGGGKFNILGNNPSRSFANLDLGTQLHLNKSKTKLLYLQYNGNYGKYMNAHTASVGYQFMF
ncbi:MAG: autotransporter domain-containing protein [Planctomycetaceae bacterium]|jgi:hypothetical protein|nr:autotransporter domain-containing protein [Planctomycetaceae bacterium]